MTLECQQVAAALDAVAEEVGLAENAFYDSLGGDAYGDGLAGWHLEMAYTQLLTLAEALGLSQLRSDIQRDFKSGCTEGLHTGGADPEGTPELEWSGPIHRYLAALRATYSNKPSRTVTKDVVAILRAATYSLSDPTLFDEPPQSEAVVHRRLEGILRCVYPDLLHKPRLTKPIKHFEPDTGIPSISTLIEYKYLSSARQASTLADEILADTRGYTSRDWNSFIYVIYESKRIKPESQWMQLLRACDIDFRTTVVVLSGDAASRRVHARRRQEGVPAKSLRSEP